MFSIISFDVSLNPSSFFRSKASKPIKNRIVDDTKIKVLRDRSKTLFVTVRPNFIGLPPEVLDAIDKFSSSLTDEMGYLLWRANFLSHIRFDNKSNVAVRELVMLFKNSNIYWALERGNGNSKKLNVADNKISLGDIQAGEDKVFFVWHQSLKDINDVVISSSNGRIGALFSHEPFTTSIISSN